jgi:hypothetical protein
MHQIYSRYGLDPFERASTLSDSMILFYFIHSRLSKKPQKFQSAQDWIPLLQKYRNVPRTTRKRHGWIILSLSGRWDCLDMYGCAYPQCPELAALQELKHRRVRGKRDSVSEDRLYRWGAASKICVRYVIHLRFDRNGSLTCHVMKVQTRLLLRPAMPTGRLAQSQTNMQGRSCSKQT